MDDDSSSVRTPTRSELNTFKVLANQDFTDLGRKEPTSKEWVLETHKEEVEDSFTEFQKSNEFEEKPAAVQEEEESRHYDAYEEKHSENASVVDYPTKTVEPSEPPKRHEEVRKETEADIAIEKEALLYELDIMEKQGLIKLHRVLSMQNSLEEIQYQYDRANMIVSTQQTVEWAKSGIKMGSSILESVLKRFGVSVVEGFSNNLCKDMSKFNKPMTKMYRKYWRRGTSSPEMELAMIVFGALAMTVMGNKGIMGGPSKPSEPLARPVPPAVPSEPSAMKGPNQQSAANRPIPEWARSALAAPQQPAAPSAPTAPSVIQNIVPVAPTIQPPSTVVVQQSAAPSPPPPTTEPVYEAKRIVLEEPSTTRKLQITSPRSSRRKKEPQVELNLDEESIE
jgi:hypothetical protein